MVEQLPCWPINEDRDTRNLVGVGPGVSCLKQLDRKQKPFRNVISYSAYRFPNMRQSLSFKKTTQMSKLGKVFNPPSHTSRPLAALCI